MCVRFLFEDSQSPLGFPKQVLLSHVCRARPSELPHNIPNEFVWLLGPPSERLRIPGGLGRFSFREVWRWLNVPVKKSIALAFSTFFLAIQPENVQAKTSENRLNMILPDSKAYKHPAPILGLIQSYLFWRLFSLDSCFFIWPSPSSSE